MHLPVPDVLLPPHPVPSQRLPVELNAENKLDLLLRDSLRPPRAHHVTDVS